MAETLVEKATCEKCGFEVRENTLFCYNCGSRVAEEEETGRPEVAAEANESETQAALDDLAARFKIEEPSADKLAKAAEERRKARVERRKPKEYTWVAAEPISGGILLLVSLVVAIAVGLLVFVLVLWK